MQSDWYKKCFRRILVDMHIPDWNEEFLAKLDAEDYVETVVSGNVTSTMLYCVSHVGLALYPSKVGPVHAMLKDKDFVGEALGRFHEEGIAVVAYYSAVFNNAMFLREPDWRIKPLEGESAYEKSRYGVCCPNSPYREFAVAQTEEFCLAYPFDGIFFDMLFWPHVCYCDYCRARFETEAGAALPEVVDWHGATWMAFQRARERWMSEFAGMLTAAVRRTRPSMTVTHQMSPVLHGWKLAMPFSLVEHCDYASGDFYGPAIQQSVVCRIFEAISTKKPFEFHTSRCVDLRDHVTMKSATRLETQASLAPAHASAFMFIDAIDPEGTLNPGVYQRIAGIFEKLAPYEPFLGGELCADVALYVSSESRFSFKESGVPVNSQSRAADNMALGTSMPHMDAVMGAAKALQEAHIPFAVVTRANLERLGAYRVVMLPNVLVMDDEEIAAFRRFVASGGALYASGWTSLVAPDGQVRGNFGLADVLGVSYRGEGVSGLSFVTPIDEVLVQALAPQQHAIHHGEQLAVEAGAAEVLATTTLPYYPEDAGTVLKPSFSSIHSNPPGPVGTTPAITLAHQEGGRACYAAAVLEAEANPASRAMVAQLVRRLLDGPPAFEAEGPQFVELTVFDKKDRRRLNLSLVALRDGEDCVPCEVTVRLRPGKARRCVALRALPSLSVHPLVEVESGCVQFEVQGLEVLKMYELEYADAK